MTDPTPSTDLAGASGAGWADRLAGLVARRESQIVLGLDPDPRRLWPARRRGARPRPTSRAARRSAALPALIDAAGEACVAVKPQLACFERLGAARLGGARRGRRARPRGRAACDRGRQARRRARHRGGLRRTALTGLGVGRLHREPAARHRRAGARWSRPGRGCSCSCGRRTRGPPTSRTCELAEGERALGAPGADRRRARRPARGRRARGRRRGARRDGARPPRRARAS